MLSVEIKVCGMKDKENILELSSIRPDYIGLIFYKGSKRFVGSRFDRENVKSIPDPIKKVGVFVNSGRDEILDKASQYGLDLVQLHGDEKPGLCQELQKDGLKVIKAFSLHDEFDFSNLNDFAPYVSFFLFDTRGKNYGGNGVAFNWEILNQYVLDVPFFLSGGIGLQHVEKIREFKHKMLFAIDLNSCFETEPGLKDIEKLKQFTEKIRG